MITTLLIIGGSVWITLSVVFVLGMAIAARKPMPEFQQQTAPPEPAFRNARWAWNDAPIRNSVRHTAKQGVKLGAAFHAD